MGDLKLTKEYLEQLKKDDYIAWDSLVNDPMLCGTGGSGGGFGLIILITLITLIITVIKLWGI